MPIVRDHNGRLVNTKWERTEYVDTTTGEVYYHSGHMNAKWLKRNAIVEKTELVTYEKGYTIWFKRVYYFRPHNKLQL